jgi:CheY-like chemotaxis protein
MVSANAMPLHLAESLEAGADLHLAKPLTAQSLIDALESVLQSYAATAAPEGDR